MDVKKQLEAIKEMEAENNRRVDNFNQDEKITAVLVDVYGTGRIKKIRIRSELEDYYRVLKCRTVDMPTRWIGGKPFTFICDDEGLFVDGCKVSALDSDDEPALVGNLLIVAYDGGEDVRGLTDEEVRHVMQHRGGRGRMAPSGGIEIWEVLKDVEYVRGS